MDFPRERTIAGEGGVPLHVLEWSEAGVPFVLLHGFGNDARIWDDFVPHVAPYYRVIALDLRGHGDSGHDPEQRYDYPHHVADLEKVLDALGIERFVLCGHSLGGRISALFAGQHPERIAGLILVDSGPELDPRGVSRIRTDVQREQQESPSFASVREYEQLLARAYPATKPEIVARMARHGLRKREDGRFERKTDPRFHAARAEMSEAEMEARERETATKLWAALSAVPCPTLVVRGAASDVLSADCADRMVEDTLAQGRLAVVAHASHSVMADNPDGFAEAVVPFAVGDGD